MNFFKKLTKITLKIKLLILFTVLIAGFTIYFLFFKNKTEEITYQTQTVEKGNLVITVTTSGQVSSTNSTNITTKATGVISEVYVSNGEQVKAGQEIAKIDLDTSSNQKHTQALASYQSAKNSLLAAENKNYSLQATMFQKWDDFKNLAENSTYQNSDGTPNTANRTLPEFLISQDQWLASEADYKNQEQVISQSKTALSAAWLSLQESSPVIYAPITGTVSGLSIQSGDVITSSSNNNSSDSSSTSSNKVANISTNTMPTLSFGLTEIDVTKVKIGNLATVTLDAFPNKTFTGKVSSIDTVGETTSDVTNYPITIKLDLDDNQILANMSASANIITQQKSDIITVPTSAINTSENTSYIQVMKNGTPTQVEVTTGIASDTKTEVLSGLSVGDVIVTNTSSQSEAANNRTSSAFSSGFGGGPGMMR